MNLSDHFTYGELVYSSTALRKGIENVPSPEQVDHLRRLCAEVLEPVRKLLGVPLHIDSGFRSPALNEAVGSTAAHSDHLDGNAADFVPIGMDLHEAFDKIRTKLNVFKQLIIECGAWIHISQPDFDVVPKLEALVATRSVNGWVYSRVV